ncbi:hypothetical protein RsTz2092_00410 [Deferribacterales bacterium RsTz2092]|nr:hypothetical protein AGMMS49941_01300 [Deferribacterales bacterium]
MARILLLWLFLISPTLASEVLGIYFTPSKDCEDSIVLHIDRASVVNIAVYSINNDGIVAAIKRAQERGAKVQVITDRLQAAGRSSKVEELILAGVPLKKHRKHKIEHNKFAVFDGRIVVTGSFNWTNPASNANSENCVFIEDSDERYLQRFEYLWSIY